MSDIRLKKITVEPSQVLTIQRGNISVTNTTISSNRLNGSFVINGGIGINCTYDSVSSTSGGALTVGGGLSVHNQTFLGNNLIIDNNSATLSVNGINTNRLFLDSVSNKYFYISPDGISKRLELFDTTLNIHITTHSTNATTGALIIDGGISINATEDAINSSNGGAFTVSGGVAVGGNTFLSKKLTVGELYTNQYGILVRYTGDSQVALQNSAGTSTTTFNMEGEDLVIATQDDLLFKTTTGNFIFSNASSGNTLLTIADRYSTFDKFVNITDTVESKNLTTASLIVRGGISVQCTTDAISTTSGGAMSIAGGLGVAKKTYIGDSLGLELWNTTKSNKFLLFQEQQTVTEENIFTGLGVTAGSLRLQVYDTNKDFTFFSSSTSGTSTEVFRIKGSNEVQFVGANQRYSFLAGGNTLNDLSIQGQSIAEPSSICFFTKDGDSNDTNDLKIFGLGQPNGVTNSEYLKLGWDTNNYIVSTHKTGSGNSSQLILQTNSHLEQIKLLTDGSIYMSSTKPSTNNSTGGLVLMGGVSVANTNDATSLTVGGALTLAGGLSVKKSTHIGNTLHIYSTSGNISFYAQNSSGDLIISNPTNNYVLANNNTSGPSTSSLTLFGLNNTKGGDYEVLEIVCNSTLDDGIYNIHTDAEGDGILKPLQINVGNNTDIFMHTNGNIGINTTNPSYQLDIDGTMRANNYNYINELTVYNTTEASDEFTSGSLTVAGGTSIAKNLFVGGKAIFTNTLDSSSTSGAVYIAGGLTVATGQASNFGSGALTVNGGGYFGGELYVQQNLNVQGQINGGGASSSTFAYLTLTATDESLNLSTGSFLTFGGITIQTYQNSENVSNGGSFLTPGGASIGKDLYIGGNLYNYGVQNFYHNTNALVNFYDTSNFKRFSIDRNTVSSDLSISRYNESGVYVEKTMEISNNNGQTKFNNSTNSTGLNAAALITVGGVTIQTTAVASTVQNGGGLTVFGGTSIVKNMYVGGNVVLSSTTASSNSNEGALTVAGGVGITGNVNILGNTVINGNLSIVGTTNTIYSTNTFLSDNILVINSGPSGSSDGGILIQRYQINNNTGDGDVVNDLTDQHDTYVLPNQSGMTTTQLKLPTTASTTDNYYVGWWIKITSGFSTNQVRKVTGYVGSTRVVTIDSIWTSQNPSLGDTIQIYNRPYVGLFWNETIDTFELGTSTSDPGTGNVTLTEFASLTLSNLTINDTINSINSSVGVLIAKGGISIGCSTEATSLTRGGALTVAGGTSIEKSLYVGSRMYIGGVDVTPNTYDQFSSIEFTAANNVTSQNIPSINYTGSSVWGFDVYLSARLIASTNLYANYHIRAVNKGSTWEIVSNYVGDSILEFNITANGQLQYSTTDFTGFSNLVFKYKVFTN
jgi:hypothetical protein